VGYVLEWVQKKQPIYGYIVGLDGKLHRVKLENGSKTLIPFLEPLGEWAAEELPEPPSLILNRNCPACQFRDMCREKAIQEDNLSLLDGISTQKAINKYEKKGLFTVKQLSYTFKPRKRRKRAKNPPPVIHKPELQALAIREKKIYLQELPELMRQPVELFLDIEGVPDRQFYYLIGLLVSEKDTTTYYPFWADSPYDEAQIWRDFLEKVSQYPDASIYHYGSFEPRTLSKLCRRYDTDIKDLIDRLVNVNKYIFGKVYFPVYSNRLKEIGAFVGAKWTVSNATGLRSLAWRSRWEDIRDSEHKDMLLSYNREDCLALKILGDKLTNIKNSADTLTDVDFANQPKQHSTKAGNKIRNQFEEVLKFAYADYDKTKINFQLQRGENERPKIRKIHSCHKRYLGHRRKKPKATKVDRVPQRDFCPKCKELLQKTDSETERIIIDLKLMKNGIKKVITKYVGIQGLCVKCNKKYPPPSICHYRGSQMYGDRFKAWLIYHRVELRMPYADIVTLMAEQFGEVISGASIPNFMRFFSSYYNETEDKIIQRLIKNPFIHVDETPVNIRGRNQYVWTFTDGKYVLFRFTENREAKVVHDLLVNYSGILISDFYPGYDSLKCRQQKCWVHLIRDINNDLWANPYDKEFEMFVLEVRNLIIPIMETIQKYGLRKRNLNKFKRSVDKFYTKVIVQKRYRSMLSLKFQERFIRYQNSLFTFLEQDGIPWHNNTAERALRHLVIQEKISGFFHGSLMPDYLRILGIRQSCRFQGKSFFKFLFSGETDLDKFEAHKRKRRA
jgi:predicted RecB family nuclease